MGKTQHIDVEALQVRPGVRAPLKGRDPHDDLGLSKDDAPAIMEDLTARLAVQQSLLAAEDQRALLCVFQGMDASGKDGTIRTIMGALNPMIIHQVGFGVPSKQELAHDFLWRIHAATPPRGEIGLFNRSHYEDVLVVRVDSLVPESVWRPRFDQIVQFERYLAETGTTTRKFFMHISPEEQLQRLRERAHDPLKRWKHRNDDYARRAQWDDYMKAYADAMAKTSTAEAPWIVVPADRKWLRNIVVLQTMVDTLEGMNLPTPGMPADLPEELRTPPEE